MTDRLAMFAHMSEAEYLDMIAGEDPDDRAIREAHGFTFEDDWQDETLLCRNGCGLAYPDISSGKIRQCGGSSRHERPAPRYFHQQPLVRQDADRAPHRHRRQAELVLQRDDRRDLPARGVLARLDPPAQDRGELLVRELGGPVVDGHKISLLACTSVSRQPIVCARMLSPASARWRTLCTCAGIARRASEGGMTMGPIMPDWIGGPPKADRETAHGYVWTVYPSNSSHAMVATGIHATEDIARGCVEHVLGITEGVSAFGVVCAPGGKYDVCRRADTETGYHWAPLYPELML